MSTWVCKRCGRTKREFDDGDYCGKCICIYIDELKKSFEEMKKELDEANGRVAAILRK